MNQKERLAGTLTRPNRPLVSWLAERGIDGANIAATTLWSNRLEADLRRWMAGRVLTNEARQISKRDADHMLRRGLFGSAAVERCEVVQ